MWVQLPPHLPNTTMNQKQLEETLIEMNKKDLFKLLYQRELARDKIDSKQFCCFVDSDLNIKWMTEDDMYALIKQHNYPIVGRWDFEESN